MERLKKIFSFNHNAGLFLGTVAALAILTSQSFYYSLNVLQEQSVVEEQSGDNNDNESQPEISLPNDLLVNAGQIFINIDWHFIADVVLDDSSNSTSIYLKIEEFNSLFRTLFRHIISPNAP